MEDNLKRLVSETTRLCREQGKQVEPFVVAYLAVLQELQHDWDSVTGGQSMATPFTPALIASCGAHLAGLILDKDSPTLTTARMQVMMEVAFKQQREAVEKEHMEHAERAGMLARAVTGPRPIRDTKMESYEKFYKLVHEYVCVQTGMDRALGDQTAGEEVRAAMESVFPLSALARFLTLGEEERLQQVEELARISLGICLYNRSTGRGGYALPASADTYLPRAQRLQRDMQRHAQDVLKEMKALGAQLEAVKEGPEADAQRQRILSEVACQGQVVALNEGLAHDLAAGLEAVKELEGELQSLLAQVQETIGKSSAVPKEEVFPLFDRLGTIHESLTSELRLLVVRQRLFDELQQLQTGYMSTIARMEASKPKRTWAPQPAAKGATEPPPRLEAPPILPDGYEYLEPSTSGLPPGLSLSGFCPNTLAESSMLSRARPSLGFIRKTDGSAAYGFSSAEAVSAFAANPGAVEGRLAALAARAPLLARTVNLAVGGGEEGALPDIHEVVRVMSGPLKVDFGSQTPTHFVDKHIDYSYEWNEWALRRRALALANLRQKKTHSTQTALTHFKRDNDTQVWEPKSAQVQTRVNKGQAMPKKLQYVAGLRGTPDTKMHVVRLDLDLGQPHQH